MALADLIKLVRVHQWVKNLFIFLPAFFGQALNEESIIPLLFGFVCFSLAASAVYIFNDFIDAPSDRLHKEKKDRPIAAGTVSVGTAYGLAALLLATSLVGAYFIDQLFFSACVFYLFQNLLYTVWLKKFALIDITIISLGFLIRLFAGGIIADVPISSWMYIMAFLLAMLLALGKRRDDLLILKNEGKQVRKAVEGYNMEFVNVISVMLSAVTVVAYIMYTLSAEVIARVGSPYVYVTSLFVFLGVLRYLQLALVYENTGSPTLILLKDNPTRLVVLSWLLTFGYLLYA
ncbi:MAG: UbiA prenyltransferase family protein [Flavobacteriales bacterium]|nr:UbiA prenyltransferase family protein [Flavobacteriales bacterium]